MKLDAGPAKGYNTGIKKEIPVNIVSSTLVKLATKNKFVAIVVFVVLFGAVSTVNLFFPDNPLVQTFEQVKTALTDELDSQPE